MWTLTNRHGARRIGIVIRHDARDLTLRRSGPAGGERSPSGGPPVVRYRRDATADQRTRSHAQHAHAPFTRARARSHTNAAAERIQKNRIKKYDHNRSRFRVITILFLRPSSRARPPHIIFN